MTPLAALHASLRALDADQRAAVVGDDAAAIVRAQVGSGKTTVLVHKAIYLHLVSGVPLADLAILTFTHRAADELHARLAALFGRALAPDERRRVGTFHGVAHALLQRALPLAAIGHRPGFTVLDDDERDALIAEVARCHDVRVPRRRLRAHARDDAALAARIADEKRARNAMDFDDLLAHATTLLGRPGAPPPPRWLLVDELQDCEPRELALLAALRGPVTRFFGVGDPLQSIYGWRGGTTGTLRALAASLGARRHHLPASYRSTATILDGARAILGDQPEGEGALVAVRAPGARLQIRRHHDVVAEAAHLADRLAALRAAGVPPGEVAVLTRLRAQADAIGAALAAAGVRCASPDDAVSPDADAIRVLTLHAAKGLEFRHVFISGANQGVVPLALRGEPIDDDEERRLFYVGITRARDEVEISYHARPCGLGVPGVPSELLLRLSAPLIDWHDHTVAPPAVEPASRWCAGQRVRHARYGAGVVVHVTEDAVECDFGKLGPRGFPRRLCPLTPLPAGAA